MTQTFAEQVFDVDPARLRAERWGAGAYFLMPVGFAILLTRIEGGVLNQYGGGVVIGLAAVASVIVVLFGLYYLRRVPKPGVPVGLVFDATGIAFRNEPLERRLDWADVVAVQPFVEDFARRPSALWLQRQEGAVPIKPRLRAMLGHRLAEAVERPSGILVPLRLFGKAQALEIVAIAVARHAAVRQ